MIQGWYTITIEALQELWQGFLNFLPSIIGAIIIFVIGWFIAAGVGRLIAEILIRLKVNKFFERTAWREALEKAELKVNPSEFIGAICKWILVIVFLLAAVEILGFVQFADILKKLVAWLPNLVVAAAIFIVAIILADILEKVIKATAKKIEVKYVDFLGAIVRWSIYIFAGLTILLQLGITPTIINTLVIGIVGMLTLGFGLAFGLGGKEIASRIIEDFHKKISEK